MTHGTILLVDDETKIRRALGSALRDEGHEVVVAGSAREAQRLITQQLFDVLVVDNLMPEMTDLDGGVATFQKRQESDWSSRPGSVSCRHLEQVVDELNLSPNI